MTFNNYLINVPVATVWTSSDSPRPMDSIVLSKDGDLREWISRQTYEDLLDLCEGNRVQTQILYGEEVLVIEENNGWSNIRIPTQPSSKDETGYPGWIPSCQLILKPSDFKTGDQEIVVTSKTAEIHLDNESKEITVSFATILPFIRLEEEYAVVKTPTGIGRITNKDVEIINSIRPSGEDILNSAEKFLGLSYLWGGMSSYGYDCSGLTYTMNRANGYTIPRDAHDQAASGNHVSLHALEKGDLLFFAYEEGKGAIHHVGLYYGDGKMLHSPNTGKKVEIIDLQNTIYERELCAARRYSVEPSL